RAERQRPRPAPERNGRRSATGSKRERRRSPQRRRSRQPKRNEPWSTHLQKQLLRDLLQLYYRFQSPAAEWRGQDGKDENAEGAEILTRPSRNQRRTTTNQKLHE